MTVEKIKELLELLWFVPQQSNHEGWCTATPDRNHQTHTKSQPDRQTHRWKATRGRSILNDFLGCIRSKTHLLPFIYSSSTKVDDGLFPATNKLPNNIRVPYRDVFLSKAPTEQ
jgi:hypothetical protein